MGIFNNLFKNNNSVKDPSHAIGDIPVLGRQNEVADEVIDDELPSVNRRKGRSKLIDTLGFGALLLSGLAMMYFVNADTGKKIEKKHEKKEIANNLPPLQMPEPPPPPPPEINVPAVQVQQQPIPVQQANQQGTKPAGPTWMDRKMAGGLVLQGDGSGQNDKSKSNSADLVRTAANQEDLSPLGLKLKSTISPGVSASMLPNRDYLITKGTALDCALETAIDSTVPGLTTCRLTRDIYSDNGHVVLLDRGSQLVGEYQGGITAGQARIFVLWTRAKTPNGIIVNLDSPGTDALGRSGHEGWVDRHFMERFGAAIIMSLVKDGLSYAKSVQASKNGGSTVTIGGENSDQLAVEILKQTVNIPPTLYVNQGSHIQVMVARDLDFSTVYGLDLKE